MTMRRHGKGRATFLVCMLMLLLTASSTTTLFGITLSPLSTASAAPSPIFGMTLIVPQDDPLKVAWAELLWNNLRQLGIDCKLVYLDMSEISSRVLDPSSSVLGKNYTEGGFDAIILGYQLPVSPDPYLLHDSSQFPPNGMNYYLWNDTQNDLLCSLIRNETNPSKRLAYETAWQLYASDQLPSTAAFYGNSTVVVNASLDVTPFNVLSYPVWPAVERWSGNMTALANTVMLAQPGNATNLLPIFSSSYYDAAVMNPIYGPAGFGLFQLSNMTGSRAYVPCIAENWTHSADYTNWTIKVRSGVEFQDGAPLTGEDVVFTLQAYMNPTLNSPMYPLFKDVFGSNSSVFVGANSSMVEIRLPKPYAYIMDLLSVPILPEHILGQIPDDEWRTSPLNTGIPSTVQLLNMTQAYLTGPTGAGPYSYVGYNKTTGTYHLEKFDNYFNRTELEAAGLFQIQNYYVNGSINNGADAIIQLLDGRVQVIDMQYHLELLGSYLLQYVPTTIGKIVNFISLNVQEVGFNMRSPILGTGLETPAGRKDPSKAADAAKDVRKAISYAIPREEIVTSLLAGYGVPGRTSVFCPLSEGYDQTIPFYDNLTAAAAELRLAGYEPASIVPGFVETYSTAILIIVVATIALVTLITLQKTRHIFKTRRPEMA